MPVIDLNIKVLPENHEVFFARPGIGYRLYPEIIENKIVLADLPALQLQRGVSFPNQPDLLKRIGRSSRLRGWHRGGRRADEPSRDLDDYETSVSSLRIAQLKSVLSGYFERAKKGDLVVVVPGAFQDLAYIGEFVDEPEDFVTFRAGRFYATDRLTGRRVKWLANTRKRELAQPILDIVAKPNAFVLLPRSVRRGLYDLAYPSYTIGDEFNSRFDVTEDTYSSYDDLIIQAFFNFVASNTQAVAEGRDGDIKGLEEAAFIQAGEFTPDLRTDISSPGFLRLTALRITPLVAAALFAIAIDVGPGAVQAAENGTLRIGNSTSPADDACVAEVHRQVIRQLRLLGLDRWGAACEKARRASENTGIHGPARIQR